MSAAGRNRLCVIYIIWFAIILILVSMPPGSSKEVARQIYQDLKQLQIEQLKQQGSEDDMQVSDGIVKDGGGVGTPSGGCCPSCMSLQMGHETRMMNLRRRWWHTKGTLYFVYIIYDTAFILLPSLLL